MIPLEPSLWHLHISLYYNLYLSHPYTAVLLHCKRNAVFTDFMSFYIVLVHAKLQSTVLPTSMEKKSCVEVDPPRILQHPVYSKFDQSSDRKQPLGYHHIWKGILRNMSQNIIVYSGKKNSLGKTLLLVYLNKEKISYFQIIIQL